MVRTIKVALAGATGARRQGGCTTSAVSLTVRFDKDPYDFLRYEMLVTWLDVYCAYEHKPALDLVWGKLVPGSTGQA
eukprot:15677519-Heterocapsa_arctica.AAC.1